MEDIKIQLNNSVKAVSSHFQAERDRAVADLEIYLNRFKFLGNVRKKQCNYGFILLCSALFWLYSALFWACSGNFWKTCPKQSWDFLN